MRYLFFTKTLQQKSIDETIAFLRAVGADGADLCVRDGYPVHPGNAGRELANAAKRMASAGLSVGMVSGPTGLSRAADPIAETLFAACHDAGVPLLKPGYWTYRPGVPYAEQLDAARRELDGFVRLAERYGVQCCVHTHSGSYLTVNASGAYSVLQGTSPRGAGYYLDPGHLALNGEPLTMAFGIAGERLSVIAVKDLMWVRPDAAKPRQSHCAPLGQGFVNWQEMMRLVVERRFGGPLTFHSEYSGLSEQELLSQTRDDVAYLRRVEREVRSAAG